MSKNLNSPVQTLANSLSQGQVMGLFGKNIQYSFSPVIHNFSISKLGINAHYHLFDLDWKWVKPALQIFLNCGAIGFNVTVPYKEKIAKLVANKNLNSVNTIYRPADSSKNKKWLVASTDARGLDLAIARMDRPIIGYRRIIILGNGGVANAICKYLLSSLQKKSADYLVEEVSILRRNSRKDREFGSFNQAKVDIRFHAFDPQFLANETKGADRDTLIIQATSAPRYHDDLRRFAQKIDPKFKGSIVELTYQCPSALIKYALERGLKHQNGIPMLIEQARLSQLLWWEQALSYQAIARHLRNSHGVY